MMFDNLAPGEFQSTRPQGARPWLFSALRLRCRFQSTRPQGARRFSVYVLSTSRTVSIHAPAGGATLRIHHTEKGSECVSIHAPAGGATLGLLQTSTACRVSIHAPAGGATATNPAVVSTTPSFNPRARRGRDRGHIAHLLVSEVSIHAPAGGATAHEGTCAHELAVSIHAPAGGATYSVQDNVRRLMCFNPRARRGRDEQSAQQLRLKQVSIHAPAGGATASAQ